MEKNLSYFMREVGDEIVSAPAPKRFTDSKGNPLSLEIRVLTPHELREIRQMYTIRKIATDKDGNPYTLKGNVLCDTIVDEEAIGRRVVTEALVYPNLKSSELHNHYGCYDLAQIAEVVFSKPGEYAAVYNTVLRVLTGIDNGNPDDGADDLVAAKKE